MKCDVYVRKETAFDERKCGLPAVAKLTDLKSKERIYFCSAHAVDLLAYQKEMLADIRHTVHRSSRKKFHQLVGKAA